MSFLATLIVSCGFLQLCNQTNKCNQRQVLPLPTPLQLPLRLKHLKGSIILALKHAFVSCNTSTHYERSYSPSYKEYIGCRGRIKIDTTFNRYNDRKSAQAS